MPRTTISVLTYCALPFAKQCLASVFEHTRDFELILTANGNPEVAAYFESVRAEHPDIVRVVVNETNLGFILPNITALEMTETEYFLCLNDDTTVGAGWLETLLAPLEASPIAAIAGPSGACCSLRNDFVGFAGGPLEYIEGSCLLGKTEILKLVGLFDEELSFAYGEDSDLSLRLRQRGYTIHQAKAAVTHVHGATSSMVPQVRAHFARNMQYLQEKWADYMRLRSFNHPIVFKHHGTATQVLMLTPIIRTLHEKQPASPVWVETDHPQVLANNPFIKAADLHMDYNPSDCVVHDFTGLWEEDPSRHILDLYAEEADVDLGRRVTEFFPSPEDFLQAKQLVGVQKGFVAVHAGRMEDAGTRWPEHCWQEFALYLRAKWKVVLVGNDSIFQIPRDLDVSRESLGLQAAVINQCAFFIGGDALPLHLAQAVGCPVVGLFGSTLPGLTLTDGSKAVTVCSDPGHTFTGARHRTKESYICPLLPMETITLEQVWRAIASAPFVPEAKKKYEGPVAPPPPPNIVIVRSERKVSLTALTCACHRPEAWALSERYMARQTVQPAQWLVLDDDDPKTICTMGQDYVFDASWRGDKSLPNKVAAAIERGLIKTDAIVFWENDDPYDPKWLEWCAEQLQRHVLVGEGRTIYYNVHQRFWFDHTQMTHASLCATAARRELFPLLINICRSTLNNYIDEALWKSVPPAQKLLFDPWSVGGKRMVIGIKAMPGHLGASTAHRVRDPFAIDDPRGERLRELIGSDADEYAYFYRFYSGPSKPPPPPPLPTIEVHILTRNEEAMLPYALRHYRTFASRIIVHDAFSTDRTREIALAAGAEVVDFDTGDRVNDDLHIQMKNTCWKGTKAEWVIPVDCDELIYFPGGEQAAFAAYAANGVAMVRPHGFEMFTEHTPTTAGQIYEQVKAGAPDDKWYAKPALFSAKLVAESNLGVGGHTASPVLKDGRWLEFNESTPFTEPSCYLLHFHHVGPIEKIAAKYDATRARLAEINVRNHWGNQGDGMKHAQEKRAYILKNLMEVIP